MDAQMDAQRECTKGIRGKLEMTFARGITIGVLVLGMVGSSLYSYTTHQRRERCVEKGMEYILSKEDKSLQENWTLRETYLTGQLPPSSVGVIPLDLPELALQRGREAHAKVRAQCRQNPQFYH